MIELIIDRSKWLHGEGPRKSCLLRNDGKKCCLGFLAVHCGAKPEDIFNKNAPFNAQFVNWPVGIMDLEWRARKGQVHSIITSNLMSTNDDININSNDREEELIRLFKELDINCKFIN